MQRAAGQILRAAKRQVSKYEHDRTFGMRCGVGSHARGPSRIAALVGRVDEDQDPNPWRGSKLRCAHFQHV